MSVLTSKSEQVRQGRVGVSEEEKQRFRIALTLVAMLLVSCMLISPNVKATDEYYPGGWLIKSGTVTKSDVNLHVSGDLIIDSTGRLVFEKNVTLIIYSRTAGEYKIQVNASGEFHILNKSVVISNQKVYGYKFLVHGTLNVQNESTVKWMWGNFAGPDGGIQILSGGDATIENSTITEGRTNNLYFTGSTSPVIKNSNVTYAGQYSPGYGIFAVDTSAPLIQNNNISNNDQYGVGVTSTSSIEIAHNQIWNNSNAGIEGTYNTQLNIHNNTIYENTGHGITLQDSSSSMKIRDNLIYSTITGNQANYEAGIYLVHSSPTVEYNTIQHFTSWSHYAAGVSCVGSSPSVKHNLLLHNARGLAVYKNGTQKSSPVAEYNNFTNDFAGIIYASDSTTTVSMVRYNNFTVLSGAVGIKLIYNYANSPYIMYNDFIGQYYPHAPPKDQERWGIINDHSSPWIEQNTFNDLNRTIHNIQSSPTIKTNTIYGDLNTKSIGILNEQSSPTISGNVVAYNMIAGVSFEGQSTSTVSLNYIVQNKRGIYLYSSSPSIVDNQIYLNYDGIYATENSSPTISVNTIENNSNRGVYAEGGSAPSVMNNDILNNVVGVSTYQANPTIQGNTIKDTFETKVEKIGVLVSYSSPTINSNDILDINGKGIECDNGNPQITYNTIKNNSYAGIGLWHCSPVISHNTVKDTRIEEGYTWSGNGIFVSNQSSPNIHNNTIKDNLGDGIFLFDWDNASHPSIRDNSFKDNGKWGIHARYTKPATSESDLKNDNTFFDQGEGWILQEWCLVVHVTDDGIDIEGAWVNVTEYPYTGGYVWSGQTGTGGLTSKITLKEYYYDNNGNKQTPTPHRVHAEAKIGVVLKECLKYPTVNHNYDDYQMELEP